jgi:hypothetical protein
VSRPTSFQNPPQIGQLVSTIDTDGKVSDHCAKDLNTRFTAIMAFVARGITFWYLDTGSPNRSKTRSRIVIDVKSSHSYSTPVRWRNGLKMAATSTVVRRIGTFDDCNSCIQTARERAFRKVTHREALPLGPRTRRASRNANCRSFRVDDPPAMGTGTARKLSMGAVHQAGWNRRERTASDWLR